MSSVNLLTAPRWRADDLGLPMPDSPHAVSACLPLWEHNVRYEEGDPEVIGRLQAAYPRFCLNPFVRELCRREFGQDQGGLIFPSMASALRAVEYCRWRGAVSAEMKPVLAVRFTHPAGHGGSAGASPSQNRHSRGVGNPEFVTEPTGVSISPDEFPRLKEYWQHSGEVLTSRAAELMLQRQSVAITETAARTSVRNRLAKLHRCSPADVQLHLCGMAAISAVWRAIRTRDAVSPSVQFGFPYVDTLKIQERFAPAAYRLYSIGDCAELDQLESLLVQQRISAVFCEAPTNPLLRTPDLQRLRELADRYDFVFVVDDTLTACINERLLPFADVVVTSLTKYFSGYGDVLAGSCVVNAASRHANWLPAALRQDFQELLPDADVEVLERNSRDIHERVTAINRTAAEIAARLQRHPFVERVFHPSLSARASQQDSGRNHGGLLSIVLRDPARTTPVFFDALRVCKGPNLGTNFTLCCPYTILAHYTELDFVESCGVSRWLLRLSIGTEPVEELWSRFEQAFAVVAG